MFFFKDFKSGKYGQFYGSVDPLKINSSLRDFCKKRGDIIFRHDSEINAMKIESYKKNAISRDEWLRMKADNDK